MKSLNTSHWRTLLKIIAAIATALLGVIGAQTVSAHML